MFLAKFGVLNTRRVFPAREQRGESLVVAIDHWERVCGPICRVCALSTQRRDSRERVCIGRVCALSTQRRDSRERVCISVYSAP